MKPHSPGARLANGLLDVLSRAPYFRGKGTLALGALRLCGEGAGLTGLVPNGGRIHLGPGATQQSVLPYWIGKYESRVVQVILQTLERLPPNAAVVDVGANLGFYTVLIAAAQRGMSGTRVYSFEPNPPIFAQLQANVGLNRFTNVTLENCALGDAVGTETLFVETYSPTTSSLRDVNGTMTHQLPIPVTTLDHYVQSHQIARVGLVKVDVEGAELLVLRGARGLLPRDHPNILYEEFETAYQQFGYSTRDVRAFLTGFGYRLYAIPEGGSPSAELEELTPVQIGAGYQNVLAVPGGA